MLVEVGVKIVVNVFLEVFYWLLNGELLFELIIGYKNIDVEYCFLLFCIVSLCKVCIDYVNVLNCGGCDQVVCSCCDNELVFMLGDLLVFIFDYFKNEEVIMCNFLF